MPNDLDLPDGYSMPETSSPLCPQINSMLVTDTSKQDFGKPSKLIPVSI